MPETLSILRIKAKRAIIERMVKIIDATRSGEKVSVICRKTNIGGDVIYQFLEKMIELGLLQRIENNDGIIYKPTEKSLLNYDLLVKLGEFRIKH